MCKVFPHPKCPHRREICRNRIVHPRFDVLYLKNAEVESFNGCGWCKWASFVQQKDPVANNNGWPGCCRPPQKCEFKLISAVDWKAVNIVFNVTIPPDVRHVLDAIAAASPTSRRATPPPAKSSSPPVNNGSATPPRPPNGSRANSFSKERTPTAIAIPTKGNKGSPKQSVAALGSVRSTTGSVSSSSPKSPSTLEGHHGHRHRQPIPDFGESPIKEKRSEGTKSSQSSPSNISKSLESEIAAPSPRRVLNIRRNSAASSSAGAPIRSGDKAHDGSVRRRSPMSSSPTTRSTALSSTSGRALDQPFQSSPKQSSPISITSPRTSKPKEDDSRSSSGSSDGPSSGSGSLSDSTVTSDGGFTDYLSDESEAELQRQAEARAALMAQNQMEEMEFKAVRQRLAHVDLRPPKTWNPTNITNTGSVRVAGGSKV